MYNIYDHTWLQKRKKCKKKKKKSELNSEYYGNSGNWENKN